MSSEDSLFFVFFFVIIGLWITLHPTSLDVRWRKELKAPLEAIGCETARGSGAFVYHLSLRCVHRSSRLRRWAAADILADARAV